MAIKKAKSFNHQVFEKAYKRLNLSSTQRIIFQRLLGFLIRNNKPFPYSAVKMSELTGFSLRAIFNALNDLEKFRLINRIGLGKNRRFIPGSILAKILTTVHNRTKINLEHNSTTVHLVHQNSINRAPGAYIKTSLYLKRKDTGLSYNPDYQEYATKISSAINLGLISKDTEILSQTEWLSKQEYNATINK